jgi:hypothetical protein
MYPQGENDAPKPLESITTNREEGREALSGIG